MSLSVTPPPATQPFSLPPLPVDGLAVDWVNNRLYFSYNSPESTMNQPNHMAYYDLATGGITDLTLTVFMEEVLNNPRSPYTLFYDMAVDPVKQ